MNHVASTRDVDHIRRHVLHTLMAAYGDTCPVEVLRTQVNRVCDGLAVTVDRSELAAATERLARRAVNQERRAATAAQAAAATRAATVTRAAG